LDQECCAALSCSASLQASSSCWRNCRSQCNATQAEQAIGPRAIIGGTPKWDITHLRGLVGVSGVYNCADLRQHFNQRGLYFSLFDRIMSFQGKTQLKALSPTYVVHGAQYAHLMPPVLLLHGTKDTCAPLYNAKQFHQALHRAGIQVSFFALITACSFRYVSRCVGRMAGSQVGCLHLTGNMRHFESLLLLARSAAMLSCRQGVFMCGSGESGHLGCL